MDITTSGNTSANRLRKNNGDQKQTGKNVSKYRIVDGNVVPQTTHTYDNQDPDFLLMQRELSSFMPDSAQIYDQMYLDQMMKKEDEGKRKIFGHDIFNNKNLTFEPNMNIATPQDYRLGPGDNVFIDIYGASQSTIESTVSPDGTVTIEGYGPISVGGLTVAEANARLRSTLGSRYSSSKITLTGADPHDNRERDGRGRCAGNVHYLCLRHRVPRPLYGRRHQRHRYAAQHKGIPQQ